jgi:hypothetical protein
MLAHKQKGPQRFRHGPWIVDSESCLLERREQQSPAEFVVEAEAHGMDVSVAEARLERCGHKSRRRGCGNSRDPIIAEVDVEVLGLEGDIARK